MSAPKIGECQKENGSYRVISESERQPDHEIHKNAESQCCKQSNNDLDESGFDMDGGMSDASDETSGFGVRPC